MANTRRAHDEAAWTIAKKICRLTARQIEMARALDMNPRKLPGLRPSPQQRWKLTVGEFIDERYRKRFGGDPSPTRKFLAASRASAERASASSSCLRLPRTARPRIRSSPSIFSSRLTAPQRHFDTPPMC